MKSFLISIIAALSFVVGCVTVSAETTRPRTAEEYASTSVIIRGDRGGGTGVILNSTSKGTIILTNKHVCMLTVNGGSVLKGENTYAVTGYKPSQLHDLCLVRIRENLGINTALATDPPELYSPAHISGHPNLLPSVVSHGDFSDEMAIEIVTSLKPCTDEDLAKMEKEEDVEGLMACIFLGGVPVVEKYESQLVTGLVLPGSSGSAVFDKDGNIAGLVFASGSRELHYGIIVPHRFVETFVNFESSVALWKRPKPSVAPSPRKDNTKANKDTLFLDDLYTEKMDSEAFKRLFKFLKTRTQCQVAPSCPQR